MGELPVPHERQALFGPSHYVGKILHKSLLVLQKRAAYADVDYG